MSRKPTPSKEDIKRKADRAEGMIPPKAEIGRPTSYQPGYAKAAEKLALLGATDPELADFFEVSTRTISRWQIEYDEFRLAVKAGKDAADNRVERSLYQKALGYKCEAVKMHVIEGEVVQTKYTEHHPPDTTAAIFWLKNRKRAEWRERTEQVVGSPSDFDRMDDAELEQWIADRTGKLTAQSEVKGRG